MQKTVPEDLVSNFHSPFRPDCSVKVMIVAVLCASHSSCDGFVHLFEGCSIWCDMLRYSPLQDMSLADVARLSEASSPVVSDSSREAILKSEYLAVCS